MCRLSRAVLAVSLVLLAFAIPSAARDISRPLPNDLPDSVLRISTLSPYRTDLVVAPGHEGSASTENGKILENRMRYKIVSNNDRSGSKDIQAHDSSNSGRDEKESSGQGSFVVGDVMLLDTGSTTKTAPVPGRSLSVQPIGLFVLGSLLLFTLGVVGYGLYEKVQYRKLYRARRLLEQRQLSPTLS